MQWNYLQLITLSGTETAGGSNKVLYASDGATSPNYYTTGLDTTYPYEPLQPTTSWPADGSTLGPASDTPALTLDTGMTNMELTETFSDYLMFLAPSPDKNHVSQWVPAQAFTWQWTVHVVQQNGTWQLTITPRNPVSHTQPAAPGAFPAWTNLVMTSAFDFDGVLHDLFIWR